MKYTIMLMLFAAFMASRAESGEECLAEAIYHEGRNQPFHGQIAIANVIKNRAKRKNKTVCEIIREPKQFSYRDRGVPDIDDESAYELALKAASVEQDLTGGAVFYNTIRQGVKWGGHHPIRIGDHVFYRGKV